MPYSKDELQKLYMEEGSIGKVASKLSKPYSTVRYWYEKNDIKVQPSCMTIYQELRETPMSQFQKSIVLGSVLGDGNLKLAPHSKNARLRIGHCKKQIGYLKWKYDMLQPFSRKFGLDQPAKEKIYKGKKFKSTDFYRFHTVVHPDITYYYRKYYNKGNKIVHRDVIDELDLISLAIWFGDDGSSYRDKRTDAVMCSFATNSFSYKEQVVLVKALRRFFGGTIKIDEQGNKGRSDLLLRMYKTVYVKDFLYNIKSILPKCIHYKIALRD